MSKLFPLREVPILKRDAIEENRCLFQLSPFEVRNFFSVLTTLLLVICVIQEHLSLVKNDIKNLGVDLTNLPELRTINCRHNKLTDKGIPDKLFRLDDLSVVVSIGLE